MQNPEDEKFPKPSDKETAYFQKIANTMKQAKEDFVKRVKQYLESNQGNPAIRKDGKVNEFEIRFGTNTDSGKALTKMDYDNVIRQVVAAGFSTSNPAGLQILRINPRYTNKQGQEITSNIRAELLGVDMIQTYCKTNNLEKVENYSQKGQIKFTEKTPSKGDDGKFQKPIDMFDMNFRVSYQLEQDYDIHSPIVRSIVAKWTDSKKNFRSMNRVRFEHPTLPVAVDLSIVQTNKFVKNGDKKIPVLAYNLSEAGVFASIPHYEIELELMNHRVGSGTEYDTTDKVMDALRKVIRIVLAGIQGSSYIIPFSESASTMRSYMRLLHGEEWEGWNDKRDKPEYIRPHHFIGPDSYTLQLENVVDDDTIDAPNIRHKYSVTEKADGERRLLFISETGKIYMIDKNMNVIFTGCKTENKALFYSLLDGEHVKYDKMHRYINLYAAFDIYYVRGKSVRDRNFMYEAKDLEQPEEGPTKKKTPAKLDFRLPLLNSFVGLLKPSSVVQEHNVKWTERVNAKTKQKYWVDSVSGKISKTEPVLTENTCIMRVECKQFYVTDEKTTIFDGCSRILSKVADGLFEYETDGLIFTPMKTGVGSGESMVAGPTEKVTWDRSFKWKPLDQNTIDFLVTTVKDKTGRDKTFNVFQSGTDMAGKNAVQYKQLQLRCGYNQEKHGYINPFNDLVQGNVRVKREGMDRADKYKPEIFYPTNPYDPDAAICNVYLTGTPPMLMTEAGEYFEESTIVEFRYDRTREPGWRWIPIRVRNDKTQKLLAGLPEYGNAYHVANNNWHSINHEVTEEMITTGKGVVLGADEVYYNRGDKRGDKRSGSGGGATGAMRNFHNLFVKKRLIMGAASGEDASTLIDYAVGKAGDISKWTAAKLAFVFGVDVSKDNILNPVDGACARYLNDSAKYAKMFRAMFLQGNSSLNLRDGTAFYGDKDRAIAKAIFGRGPKDMQVLGKGVFANYGVAEHGFNISSCQFAFHYFWESAETLHNFMRNLAECTKIQGYFIATCYDGKSVFDRLSKKEKGESISFYKDTDPNGGHKICEIVKKYDGDIQVFPEDEQSIGMAIDVYQESINKVFREYLVSWKYLVRIMEDYGFTLPTKEEAQQMGLPNVTGLFGELFADMKKELEATNQKKNAQKQPNEYGDAIHMSAAEKEVSFLNRYMIFRKTTTVPAEKISKLLINAKKAAQFDTNVDEIEKDLIHAMDKEVRLQNPVKGEIRKVKARAVLRQMSTSLVADYEAEEEEEEEDILMTDKVPRKKVDLEEDKKNEEETDKDEKESDETDKENDLLEDTETEDNKKDTEEEPTEKSESPAELNFADKVRKPKKKEPTEKKIRIKK
jgi:hypothetical protein